MSRHMHLTRTIKRRVAALAVAAMVVGTTAACGGGDEQTSSDGTVKIRLATSLIDSLPFMTILQVAKDKGWFKEEGINLEIIAASGGGDTAQALRSGAADLAITGPDAVLKLAQKSGGSIVTIGPWMNYNIVYWMAADSSVPLKGATLGITGAGSTGEMIGKAVIAAKPDMDIKLVVAGGLGAQWAAAKAGKISGAYSASPASTALEQEEGAVVLVAARDVIGDIPMDLVAAQKSYADEHPEAVKAFWKVIDRGYTYIREDTKNAVTDLNKVIKMNRHVLLSAVEKEVESPLSYSIKVDCDVLYNLSDVMIKGGVATHPVDWTKAMDQQYLPSEDQANCSGS